MQTPRIGFVGLGIMGVPMVQRLCQQGFAVTAWNLEPESFALVEDSGATWAPSPAAVWSACDVAVLCILGDDAIRSVCLGEQGFAAAGQGATLLIDMSTTSPACTAQVAEALRAHTGAAWVDAPVSGGPLAAADGTLTFMIGGNEADCAKAAPVMDALAGNVTRMGDLGAGQRTKVLNQAIVGVGYVLMAEVLAAARKSGIAADKLADCLKGGMADSMLLQRIYTQMEAADFDPPRSYARQLNKDLKSVETYLASLDLDCPVTAAAIARYRAFTEAGNEMADGASISRIYE